MYIAAKCRFPIFPDSDGLNSMGEILKPANQADLVEAVSWAISGGGPIEILGGGSKQVFGRPVQSAATLDLSRFTGISEYEPAELTMTAGAGTPLSEIEDAVAANQQMLAFEPADYRSLLGTTGAPTLGGVIACNLSGPRRIKAGAARDHFLGVAAVSGRAEIFKAGGKVVKNVTGYDLCKVLAGSFGTLAVLHEMTIKVLPAPESIRTVLIMGLDDAAACAAMARAMGSPNDVSSAAHLPSHVAAASGVSYVSGAGRAITALRIEGVRPSVVARCDTLRAILGEFGDLEELHSHNSQAFWREVRDVSPFAGGSRAVWRLSVPPARGADVTAHIRASVDCTAMYDWAGGLIWLSVPASADASEALVRGAVAAYGGHATLIRAAADVRTAVAVFQPQAPALAALSARIKTAFDPEGVLNPGRMYQGV